MLKDHVASQDSFIIVSSLWKAITFAFVHNEYSKSAMNKDISKNSAKETVSVMFNKRLQMYNLKDHAHLLQLKSVM